MLLACYDELLRGTSIMIRKLGLIVSIFSLSSSAFAVDDSAWTSNLELGYVKTTGNTEVSSMNAKGKAIRNADVWRTTVQFSALNVSDKAVVTAEKYDVSAQEDWKISESGYLFGRLGFDTDRFGGFRSRSSETLGYGFDILKDEQYAWNAELGIGARQTELTTGDKTSDTIARVATFFGWKISETATFSQELNIEGGKEGTVTNSETALLNQIAGNLSSKISYSVQHTSEVPVATEKTNTELAVSLVFAY